eukprot:89479_1
MGISARSKWGYAYSAEIGELKKIKLPKFPYKYKVRIKHDAYGGYYETIKVVVNNETEYWDEDRSGDKKRVTTAAVFALAKGNTDIVEWLEQKRAVRHKGMSQTDAKNAIEVVIFVHKS